MVDIASAARTGAANLLPLLRAGLSSLVRAWLIGQSLTFVGAALAWTVSSRHGDWAPRFYAGAFVLLAGTVTTLLLAPKRAVFVVATSALQKLELGSALFQVVFRYLLQVTDDQAPGDRLGQLGNALETRIPLARAEAKLRTAVARVTLEQHSLPGLRGWLLSKVRLSLLSRVSALTLTRFRRDNQSHGAVDLIQVRDELGAGLDSVIIDQLENISFRTTLLFSSITAALCTLATWTIYWTW